MGWFRQWRNWRCATCQQIALVPCGGWSNTLGHAFDIQQPFSEWPSVSDARPNSIGRAADQYRRSRVRAGGNHRSRTRRPAADARRRLTSPGTPPEAPRFVPESRSPSVRDRIQACSAAHIKRCTPFRGGEDHDNTSKDRTRRARRGAHRQRSGQFRDRVARRQRTAAELRPGTGLRALRQACR